MHLSSNRALTPSRLLQSLLAVIGWGFFAWTTSRWLQNGAAKVISAAVLLAFAFSPQVAEWDGLLSPESLSVTLLVVSFALLQEIVFRIATSLGGDGEAPQVGLVLAWLTTFVLWIFLRDVHLYFIPTTIGLLLVPLLHRDYRRRMIFIGVILVLVGVFVLGDASARDSRRATRVSSGERLR